MESYYTDTTSEYPNEERVSLKREVHDLLEDAGTEDWDGEGALALEPETVAIAQKLIDEFPPHVGRSDVVATPHGEVDFDWVIDRNMLPSALVPQRRLHSLGCYRAHA